MREIAFIKQNKEKWLELDEVISNNIEKTPDEIADLHVKIMNDLSYAQTFYPKSNVSRKRNTSSAAPGPGRSLARVGRGLGRAWAVAQAGFTCHQVL